MRRSIQILSAILLLPLVTPFSCSLTASSIPYDLSPLKGIREDSKDTSTPPTTSEAKVRMELCDPDGIGKDDAVSDEDQCPPNTRVCLTLVNHKPSASEPDRVTAVIPFWPVDIPEEDVFTTPMGKKGEEGLKIYVQGPDYAGVKQHINLTLLCSESDTASNPYLVSYTAGLLSLEWSTPAACPRSLDSPSAPSDDSPKSGGGSGVGFWGFIKFLFWFSIIGLIAYFAIGIFYNHQQYSARGWDLVPHRDFWREVPVLLQDLFSHLFAGIRGSSSGRGGYSSLG
ncbi:uncharacterized protein IL334_007069 [Kwoniella shivajii]|uniref:Autophagy-related protein 27 n=1 Tax=Kwoniella shivajii TaxID=564305 RepID=A0ABZ1D7N4_9TREE|nr:hypothetical protein IL334_007069 [Kwoniella shivajii]